MTKLTVCCRLLIPIVFAVILITGCDTSGWFSQHDRTLNAGRTTLIKQEIETVNCDDSKRIDAVRQLFKKRNLDVVSKQFDRATNLVFESGGSVDEVIVVGAHFDKTTLGCGAIDNWTGIVLLRELAGEFARLQQKRTYRFVAFGAEEKGLWGSDAMAREIDSSGSKKPCAMVNLDSFGFDKTWALENVSDRTMLMKAADLDRSRGSSFSIRKYQGASSDSQSFQKIGVPSITLSGLNDNWRDYIHKRGDQVGNINFEMVAENFDFIRAFLLELDEVSCEELAGNKKSGPESPDTNDSNLHFSPGNVL